MNRFDIKFLIVLVGLTLAMVGYSQVARANEQCDCYPHEKDWKEPENHGVEVLQRFKNGQDEVMGDVCRECHGSDLTGAGLAPSCYSCHAPFPHSVDWKEPTVHGVWAKTNGVQENCQNACHGVDYLGGLAEKSCYECHDPYPHAADWAKEEKYESEDFHGKYVLAKDAIDARTCNGACHGTDFGGGLSDVACSKCHEAYPHMKNWSRPTTHGVYANTFGVQEQCAIGCHGKNFEGGNTKISCYNCHENYPHEENYISTHEGMATDEVYQCASLCHGNDLSGGLSGVECLSCHLENSWTFYNLTDPFGVGISSEVLWPSH